MLREMTRLITQDLDLSEGREAYWTPLDNILLLRPVEVAGSLDRIVSVLKMRYSDHDRRIHGYTIGERGVEIGERLTGLQGLLMGLPRGDA
jgi:circadian clock protein KaiC